MDENKLFITKFVEEFKNTLVLDYNKVVVLRGWCEDNDPITMDYYWICQDLKGQYYQTSCVGEMIPLKGFISKPAYETLINFFQNNLDLMNQKVL